MSFMHAYYHSFPKNHKYIFCRIGHSPQLQWVVWCGMNEGMPGAANRGKRLGGVALCVLLSLLLHGAVAWWLCSVGGHFMAGAMVRASGRVLRGQRTLQIVRAEEQPAEASRKAWVKTDPSVDEKVPQKADFIGARSSVASGSEFSPKRTSEAPVPTQNGEEIEDELVTFDQARQTGELEQPPTRTLPSQQAAAEAIPTPGESQQHQSDAASVTASQKTRQGAEDELRLSGGRLHKTDAMQERKAPITIEAQVRGRMREGVGRQQRPTYDPALADHMQGKAFRTYERRTRSTGRFVIGSRPALNVASTPQGRYEEEIYRRIAYFWYLACDDHRGDIIPGSVVVSLRINERGLLENMDLVRRRGASVIQQSFTFGAIRRAELPPMPAAVRSEIAGDVLELIFTFNFD